MKPIFGDIVSIPAALFKEKLKRLSLSEAASAALRDRIVGWDGRMDANAVAAASYSALRVRVTRIVAESCGLVAGGSSSAWHGWVDSPTIITHFWWIVPTLLRDDDRSLLGGKCWDDVLTEALLLEAASESSDVRWSDVHTPTLVHPLTSVFPESADVLNLDCVAIGGDGDTVMATAFNAGTGLQTVYSSLARYAFDVGAWSNSEWIVFQGASGCPGNRHRGDQNRAWGELSMVPMLYSWAEIATLANGCLMVPGEPDSSPVQSMPGR